MTTIGAQDGDRREVRPDSATQRRDAVEELTLLLRIPFPEQQSLDILTVADVKKRYPLTNQNRLGAPATAAVEKAQRIIYAAGDSSQIGLCEFHIGLIYLHWDDSRSAARQFALARHQWSLSGIGGADCLCYYAQGQALRFAFHFETAMTQYGRAIKCLDHNKLLPHSDTFSTLEEELRPRVERALQSLQQEMWPRDEEPAAGRLGNVESDDESLPHETALDQLAIVEDSPSAGRAPGSSPPGARPREDGPRAAVAMPIINLRDEGEREGHCPIPGHNVVSKEYNWYVVQARGDSLLPDIKVGDWLLVESAITEEDLMDGELLVVAGKRPSMGSILLRLGIGGQRGAFFFVGHRAGAADSGSPGALLNLYLDGSGQPTAAPSDQIVGRVTGIWQPHSARQS